MLKKSLYIAWHVFVMTCLKKQRNICVTKDREKCFVCIYRLNHQYLGSQVQDCQSPKVKEAVVDLIAGLVLKL